MDYNHPELGSGLWGLSIMYDVNDTVKHHLTPLETS